MDFFLDNPALTCDRAILLVNYVTRK